MIEEITILNKQNKIYTSMYHSLTLIVNYSNIILLKMDMKEPY